jgi:hypothetical protein
MGIFVAVLRGFLNAWGTSGGLCEGGPEASGADREGSADG